MVKIMSDTSTLFSLEQGIEEGVAIVPLSVTVAGETYREFEEIDSATFLAKVREGHIPISSQPSLGETVACYEQYAEEGIINITMADGLSGTYQSALAAKNMVDHDDRIQVINSATLCGPHRYLVRKAVRLAKEGLHTQEILQHLEESLHNHKSFLIPQDFAFLKRGGRLTPLAAAIGGLLKTLPVMEQTADGKRLEKFALCRTFNSAMKHIIKHFEEMGIDERYLLSVSHADNIPHAHKAIEALKEAFAKAEIEILELSPAFITQGGPRCVAIQAILK